MSWLTGWSYRKSITVSHAAGALSNYQVKLLVGESSGATGEDVDCVAHCLTTFNDLRFTTSDETTLLDYWIDSITGATPNQLATVWIEFNSIGTGATTFYMYYGKADATAGSNGANTFIVFDDFERGSDGDTIGGSWTEVAAHVHISTEQHYGGSRSAKLVGAATNPYASIPVAPSQSIAIDWKIYKEDAGTGYFFFGDGTNRIYIYILADEKVLYWDTGSKDTGKTITKDAWQILEINNCDFASAHTYDIYVNDVLAKSGAAMNASSVLTNTFTIYTTGAANNDCYVDNVLVRNWTSTAPAWGSFGAEENAPTGPTLPLLMGTYRRFRL